MDATADDDYARALRAAAQLDLPDLARLADELARLISRRRAEAAQGRRAQPAPPSPPAGAADPVARWAACAALAAQGFSRGQIAATLGLSKGAVARSLRLQRIVPESARAAVAAGRLPERVLARLADLVVPWDAGHPLAEWLSPAQARQALMEGVARAGWQPDMDYEAPLRLAAGYFVRLAVPRWQREFIAELRGRPLDVQGAGVDQAYRLVECRRAPFQVQVGECGDRFTYTVVDSRTGCAAGPARSDRQHARAEAERLNRQVAEERGESTQPPLRYTLQLG